MRYNQLGNTGLFVSEICLGTMTFGAADDKSPWGAIADVDQKAADAIVELQSYGVAATADKYLEQIKQEVAESKAAVEVATGAIDTKIIERERTARKIKAAGILQQFEMEMGISKPAAVPDATKAPSVGGRVGEKQGS
jgi:hypothetical protein